MASPTTVAGLALTLALLAFAWFMARCHEQLLAEGPARAPWLWSLSTGSGPGGGSTDDPARPRRPLVIADIASRRARIRRWIVGFGVPNSEAHDIAQHVMKGAWQSRARYDPHLCRLDTWLYKIALHHANNYLKSVYARRVELTACAGGAWHPLLEAETPEDAAIRAQARRHATILLDRLPPMLAAVLMAHDYAGERPKDIAVATGKPLTTVLGWIRQGRAALDRELRREDAKASHWAAVARRRYWKG